jgi:hypothetical protein
MGGPGKRSAKGFSTTQSILASGNKALKEPNEGKE